MEQPSNPKSELTLFIEGQPNITIDDIGKYLLGNLGDNLNIPAIQAALEKIAASTAEFRASKNSKMIGALEDLRRSLERIITGFEGLHNTKPLSDLPTTENK